MKTITNEKDFVPVKPKKQEWPITKKYNCPHCQQEMITQMPTDDTVGRKGYWDSMSECHSCKGMYFLKKWPNGKLEIITNQTT